MISFIAYTHTTHTSLYQMRIGSSIVGPQNVVRDNVNRKLPKVGRSGHGRMGTLWLRGAEGLICLKLYTDKKHKYQFLPALPEFSPLFCPNLGGQLPPCPLARTPMGLGVLFVSNNFDLTILIRVESNLNHNTTSAYD